MDSLCISLTSPATLEHLELNIRFYDAADHVRNPFYDNLRDVWSHLDSITTYSTSSQLQRVDINIGYDGFEEIFEEEVLYHTDDLVKSALDSLPLLRAKGVLFVKAV